MTATGDAQAAYVDLGEKLQALIDEHELSTAALGEASARIAALEADAAADAALIDALEAEVQRLKDKYEPVAKVALGVNSTHIMDWKAKGGPVAWNRVFAQTQAWSATSGPWKLCVDAANRGEKVAASSKPPVPMSQIATGSQDAYYKAIATGLAGLPTKGAYTFFHEPEDDIERGDYTFATFIAASKAVYKAMRPILEPKGWRLAVCLMGWTADPASGRKVGNYFDAGLLDLIDIIAWDPYNHSGCGDPPKPPYATKDPRLVSADKLFTPCVTETLSRNKVPMIFEVGCGRREADTAGTERSEWWESVTRVAAMSKFEAIMHFEMDPPDNKADYAIRNEPRSFAAFKALGA